MAGKFTPAEIVKLKALGWDFLPYAPDEWQWMKFDADGKCIAIQCDQTWARDCYDIERELSA